MIYIRTAPESLCLHDCPRDIAKPTSNPTLDLASTSQIYTMSFPNMTPPMGGMGGGPNMQGMSDQEQMMVKGVCCNCTFELWRKIADVEVRRCTPQWNPAHSKPSCPAAWVSPSVVSSVSSWPVYVSHSFPSQSKVNANPRPR